MLAFLLFWVSLPFRIPACIVPILLWNILRIWMRCSKVWMRSFPVDCIYLRVSFVIVVATTVLPELDPFFMLPDPGPQRSLEPRAMMDGRVSVYPRNIAERV